jgi:hypothetical protein
VKLESVEEAIKAPMAIEEKLRHIVPPAVRAMQEELRAQLQEIVGHQYDADSKAEGT